MHEQLAEYWRMALEHCGIQRSEETHNALREIEHRMSQPHRYFHTGRHVVEVCRTFLELAPDTDWIGEGLMACLMHDVVYDINPKEPVTDNEARSAAYAAGVLLALNMFEQQVALVIEMIVRSAEHQYEGRQHVIKAFLDADLSILGAQRERYREYVVHLRREYSAVTEDAWREGRKGFLERQLAREHVFLLPESREIFESQARANMSAELAALS